MKNKFSIIALITILSIIATGSLLCQELTEEKEIKPDDISSARNVRRAQLDDPFRPVWHLTIAEGKAISPFDPNGAFFKDGVYHMFHIYAKVINGIGNMFRVLICFTGVGIPMICNLILVIRKKEYPVEMLLLIKTILDFMLLKNLLIPLK